jgi:inosine-uridine nucleoside N-ribohydrolase
VIRSALLALMLGMTVQVHAQAAAPSRIAVLVDMDIGDDIDDAFALGLLLQSPELQVLGIDTAWGDTALRSRLLQRFLAATSHVGIPIAIGAPTASSTPFTQARYAEQTASTTVYPAAVDVMLEQIRRHPGEITLVALGPLTNLGAAIAKDPATFGKLKRIVMMGGSVEQGYGRSRYDAPRPPDAEYNIVSDRDAARQVFASGVPITMMPLDSTRIRFGEIERQVLFSRGSPLTDQLGLLYLQWSAAYTQWASQTPTLFDVVPVAWLVDPTLCPTRPMHIGVDEDGHTRAGSGAPNADVCLASDPARIIDLTMQRLSR